MRRLLEVCVEDDGRGPASGRDGQHAGNGLLGMRERADLYGGTVEVHHRQPQGTRVLAVLPVGASR